MSSTIINNIKNIEKYSYLELGVADNHNFNQIKCLNKQSVDINGAAKFTGTTDDFFKSNKDNFDIIYIDANHDIDFVVRDFNNSIDICNKMILIHDMIPPTTMHSLSRYCSDSYKLLYHFWKNNFNILPINNDFGLTVILPEFRKAYLSNDELNLKYEDFMFYLFSGRKLYTEEEVISLINNI
jgi:hypothetical protein